MTLLPVEFSCHFIMKEINYVIAQSQKIMDNFYDPIKFKVIKPRLSDKIWTRIVYTRPRTPWTYPVSVFAPYVVENDTKINECFEMDYSGIKLPKMTDQDAIDVKEELRAAYKTM